MKNVFENCKWVGSDPAYSTSVIRRRFTLPRAEKATLTITGLGFFEARINGRAVTDRYFLPVVSDYSPRSFENFLYPLFDETGHRIYYYTFDVTDLLIDGENLLEIALADGWYRQNERVCEGDASFGDTLMTIYRLDAGGVTLCSDGSETQTDSVLRESKLFLGEILDATYTPQPEKPVLVLPAPKSELVPAIGTPDAVISVRQPALLSENGGKKLFDAGENVSGFVQVTTSAPAGSKIRVRFAEALKDGALDFRSAGGDYTCASGRKQIMEDTFITDGETRVFCPKFVWHAFRYFEIEGEFDAVDVRVVHAVVEVNSIFSTNLEGCDFLNRAFLRTQLNNMHGSIPSDCPHRERLGYTGDGQLCAPAAMMMLDSRAFYEKWIQDILDCQDRTSGHVQHTAPFMGGGGGPGGWGSAIVLTPWAYYRQYGDVDMLRKCFEPMCRFIAYMESRCEDDLVAREEKGGWCLGDWCTLGKVVIPEKYVNSCYFVKDLAVMEEIASLLGEDSEKFHALRVRVSEAIRRTYFNPGTGHFAGGVQGADAYAVWCGIAGHAAARLAAYKYDKMGHFDTGFLGTDILLEVLFDHGFDGVALKLLESEMPGSFLHMKKNGATTLWETWTGDESLDHPMFGGCARHLFTGVLGMRQRAGSAGWRDVIISPARLPEGRRASGSIETPLGTLHVCADFTGETQTVTVHAPDGMKVEIWD